jgi:hypothetical protein
MGPAKRPLQLELSLSEWTLHPSRTSRHADLRLPTPCKESPSRMLKPAETRGGHQTAAKTAVDRTLQDSLPLYCMVIEVKDCGYLICVGRS